MPVAVEKKPISCESADPVAVLDRALRVAIVNALGEQFADADPVIKPSQNPQFGDFQANCAMALAKQLNQKPRDVAMKILAAAPPELNEIAEKPDVAGPGFINIRLKPEAIGRLLSAMDSPALGIAPSTDAHSVVIDMCGVNVAKQMHVGHLRATIIGESLARVHERLGRTVFRENHLGDWGLPIAMVLHQLRKKKVNLDTLTLDELDRAYRSAQMEGKGDIRGLAQAIDFGAGPHRIIELEEQNAGASEAIEGAKLTLVQLQQGDPELLGDWHKLIDCTMRGVNEILDILGVDRDKLNNHGESFYRDQLPGVVDAFKRAGVAIEDDGAIVVRYPDRERPMLIRKSDGGFLYDTTDLAGVRYRVQTLGADRVVYVVDVRQRDRFRDVFDAAHMIGWDRPPGNDGTHADLVHVGYGMVLGPDRAPLKTRSGENISLMELLQEAIDRGIAQVTKRSDDPKAPTHGLPLREIDAIGKAVGLGAVKYADLSNDLMRDYVFSFDRMIAFEGNTGPYLQYAHARICSIFAKAGVNVGDVTSATFKVSEPVEKQLALALLRYAGVVNDVARTLEPHRLCTYLHELANIYSSFYDQCPVLKAASESIRASRLRLCDIVRRVLEDGLRLLGIDAPQRM